VGGETGVIQDPVRRQIGDDGCDGLGRMSVLLEAACQLAGGEIPPGKMPHGRLSGALRSALGIGGRICAGRPRLEGASLAGAGPGEGQAVA
jgi:hypothetical protein